MSWEEKEWEVMKMSARKEWEVMKSEKAKKEETEQVRKNDECPMRTLSVTNLTPRAACQLPQSQLPTALKASPLLK